MRTMIKNAVLFALIVFLSACTLDFPNPNAATEDQLDNKEALIALAAGIQREYSVNALNYVVFTTSLTTHETSLILTNVANQEVEQGTRKLLGTNLRMNEFFSSLTRMKGMAETLIEKVPEVVAPAGTSSGLLAWGKFFRAVSLAALAQSWEQVPLVNSRDNDAAYVTRQVALDEAIKLLDEALEEIGTTAVSEEFKAVFSGIDLKNACNAHLSRYHLMAGNYQKSIDAANLVDLRVKSVFEYDNQNQNPMYVGMVREGELLFYASRDNFGLPAALAPETGDERISFYLTEETGTPVQSKLSVREGTNSPFFKSATSEVPVYLPGEMFLNMAEAYARMDNIAEAVRNIDSIRTKTKDAFEIMAKLPVYSGTMNKASVLDEIYKNRRIELHLTGLSLEDSRRFGRSPGPVDKVDYTAERNRNFYPYPSAERVNNPNTPDDPDF